MRIFSQLTEEEVDAVIENCVGNFIDSIMDNEFKLDTSNQDKEVVEFINEVNKAMVIINEEKKYDFIINNDIILDNLHDMAYSIAQDAYYHDEDEIVFFPQKILNEQKEVEKEEKLDLSDKIIVDYTLNTKKDQLN